MSPHRTSPHGMPPHGAVCSHSEAVALCVANITIPLCDETLCFMLGPSGVCRLVVRVAGTSAPDHVLEVASLFAQAAQGAAVGHMVLASVRPDDGLLAGDVDRWFEASALTESHGVQLLEWLVACPDGFFCPRDLVAEPARWIRRQPDW